MKTFLLDGNPILRHLYTADPTAIVYDGKVYLYTGHDEAPPDKEEYFMNDWRCFSSDDLKNWIEHPVPLKAKDFPWASGNAYASKVIERDGQFYWYVAVEHASIKGSAIGVARSESPSGPFIPCDTPVVTHEMLPHTDNEKANLDPSVLLDDDGKAYMFWGNGKCYFATLNDDLIGLEGPIKTIDLPGFEEGAHIHKRNNWYYLSYGYGMPERVVYVMSRSINGPWEFKGILNEIPGNCKTNRPCILDFKGITCFFYHNGALKDGGSHRRSVCIDRLHYNADGTMQRIVMTSEGVKI